MQLKPPKNIKSALAVATASLIGVTMPPAIAAQTSPDWEFDSALLLYAEVDRVSAVEPVISGKIDINEDESVSVRFVLDSLTGASPNGAVPMSQPQTFSRPSGEGIYKTPANEVPLDPSFLDARGAMNVNWQTPLSDRINAVFGANVSKEFDYTSLGISASLSWDFNQRATTLLTGVSLSEEIVKPVGGIPKALNAMPTTENSSKPLDGDSDNKSYYDLLLGVTQIMSRRTLMQWNITWSHSSGYLTDPYKIISVVDTNGQLSGDRYLYESRPESRDSYALYWKISHQFTDDVVDISYRYFWDDWDIESHTVDIHYRFELDRTHYIKPHIRYYQQSAANFYHYFLLESLTEPLSLAQHASADYRLGDMVNTTFGVLYGYKPRKASELTFRVELMTQSGESHPAEAVGALKEQDLFPDVVAYIIQVGYSYDF